MNTVITYFLMLMPAAGSADKPVYVQPFADPVACQIERYERTQREPGKLYECVPFKGPADLSKPPAPPPAKRT